MRTPTDNIKLAELLFPEIKETTESILTKYPKRNTKQDAMILRFAPSPTGFLHIGGVYTALLQKLFAKQTNGISILRIEDTDKTREIDNGIDLIIDGLKGFNIIFNEGVISKDKEVGNYGPYIQSKRLNIYKTFAKDMVSKGYAYPCFMQEKELNDIREKQKELGVRTGCYGEWAKWRNADLEEIKQKLNNKEEYVIRLYSTGDTSNTFSLVDLVKGKVTLRENDMDSVLLKSDGYPVYHFAHPIDDTLMGITHVIRGEEWFASLPLHIEIFNKLGFALPYFCHISPLMKLDTSGGKRKLSKRKDPEADVQFYIQNGYPKEGVIEYLLNLANSNFYDWRKANPKENIENFTLRFDKFNKSGALFDIIKLDNICKDYLATLSAQEIYDRALEWSSVHNENLNNTLKNNKDYCIKIFNIERTGEKIRKDIVKLADIEDQINIFFKIDSYEDITNQLPRETQNKIIEEYIKIYNYKDNNDQWFDKVKQLANKLGYKVGEVAMVIRVAITGRTRTPDLYQVMNVLGETEVLDRLKKY